MNSTPLCWFCSEAIRPTDRTKVAAELNVPVHVGCFDRLYETEGPKSWSNSGQAGEPGGPPNDDDEEAYAR